MKLLRNDSDSATTVLPAKRKHLVLVLHALVNQITIATNQKEEKNDQAIIMLVFADPFVFVVTAIIATISIMILQ
jgi:hypothetical protein